MAVHFSRERWENIRKTYGLWWKGCLDRPIIKVIVQDGFDPEGRLPRAPFLTQENCTDFSYSPDELVEAMDYKLSQYEFLGDAFPMINFDTFGPGILAGFCGAKVDNSSGKVWFFPEEEKEIADIHVVYNPDSVWVKRIKSIYEAGHKRWKGNVLMGMPDLGGILDVAAVFRGSENLLYDLYDEPDEVKRLCGEIECAWMEAYNDLNSVLQPMNPGYSDWLGIYSDKETYVLQSDFCYMIGTPMFDEFVLPSLKRACEELDHSTYHLDGVGEISHLDHLLEIDRLDVVQWMPGVGQPSTANWIPLYKKIMDAGKGIKVEGDFEDFEKIYAEIPKKLFFEQTIQKDQREDALKFLEKYGVPK